MTTRKHQISPVQKKARERQLRESDWYGDPVVPGEPGPWEIGQECVYVLVPIGGGRLKVFAAGTNEQAIVAARRWVEAEQAT